LVSQYVVQKQDFEKKSITQKLDSVFTHPLWGYVCMVAIFYLVFLSIFSWSEYPMQLIENIFYELNTWLQTVLPSNWFTSLLTDGVLAGIGGLLVFIPQIAFLFIFIGILEESGYMARIMFLMDRLMKPFGLNGKSIVPLFSGAACAIPAIMSCRGIANRKERLITIFITPLISCSARIPVYTIMIGLVIPVQYVWGVFNLQGLVMLGLYALGFAMALITAFALKLIVKSDEKSFFILEMPTYKIPSLRNIGLTVLDKVKSFITEAGKVILAISIVLWFLANNGFESNIQSAISEVDSKFIVEKDTLESYNFELAAARLEASYAGSIGKLIEPIISPLGFDWKIGIAILTSFAAREVFVGTLSTIYSVQDAEDFTRLREKMSLQKDKDGNPYFNLARGLSILVFYAFALQCMSTISVVYKETRSKKIVLFQLLYLSFLAYMSAFIVFNIF
jgi:ferrous iron transport protein B